ncbi:hypothetical protein G6662_09770, partial [Polynucleobacter paneuropaeus]|nr:hypothetical protein [Polynucleobacter paneuropaeus]
MLYTIKSSMARLAAMGLILSLPYVANGQIAPPLNYEKNLSEVIVTATRSDTPLDQVPLNTTILTKEVLE